MDAVHIVSIIIAGQLSFASVCYDKAIQKEPSALDFRQGMLKCRLDLGELCSALDLANGMVADRFENLPFYNVRNSLGGVLFV